MGLAHIFHFSREATWRFTGTFFGCKSSDVFQASPLEDVPDVTIMRTTATLLGRPLMWAYFVSVDDCVIDSGNRRCDRRALAAHLRASGLDRRATRLLNTHLHEDHCGNTDLLLKMAGVEVLMPGPKTQREYSDMGLPYRIFWGIPAPTRATRLVGETETTDSGRTIHTIHTPGHTQCHAIYRVMPDDILITGDAVPMPSRKVATMLTEDYLQILETLRRVRALLEPGTRVITGHCGLVRDPAAYMDRRVQAMGQVVDQVRAALAAGASEKKAARQVCGKDSIWDWIMAPRISRVGTVRSIRQGLAREGRAWGRA